MTMFPNPTRTGSLTGDLAFALYESHEPEILDGHGGDKPPCSYCVILAEALDAHVLNSIGGMTVRDIQKYARRK